MEKNNLDIKRAYEAIIIMNPNASEEQQKNLFQKNAGIIKSFEGETFHVDTWGSRTLANPIKKNKRGIYFHTTFEAKPTVISELERTMGINDNVLRFVHTRLESGVSLQKHVENFKDNLKDSMKREKEKDLKKDKKSKFV